jgi:superfamily II DNA or RNA helicase
VRSFVHEKSSQNCIREMHLISVNCLNFRTRSRERDREREKEREREREKEREKERERRKRGLPPIKKDHLCGEFMLCYRKGETYVCLVYTDLISHVLH